MPQAGQIRIRELDGLRGLAVLAVIDKHYQQYYPRLGSQFGWLGVDLFFVLSGFLITSILLELREERHYFRTFYARRALRILPPYLLGIGTYLGITAVCGVPIVWKVWLGYIFYYSSLFAMAIPDLSHGTADILQAVGVGVLVLWSLSVEEIYYTLWAPLVRFVSDRGIACVLVCMIIVAPLLRWYLRWPGESNMMTFYCRMDGLAYGSGVALLARYRNLLRTLERWDRVFDCLLVVFLGVTILFAAVVGDFESRPIASIGIALADLCFASVVFVLVRNAGGGQWWVRIFRAKWLRSVGKVSYSLYLFHYPLYVVAGLLVGMMHLSRHVNSVCALLLGLAMSFAVAYGLWYGMESRILRWKDRKVPRLIAAEDLVVSA